MLKIVIVPSDVLRKPAKPVLALDTSVLNILENMKKTLKDAKNPQGVGLAAPQIGVSLRIFLIRPVKNGPVTIFINPEIVKFSQRQNVPTGKKRRLRRLFIHSQPLRPHQKINQRDSQISIYQSTNNKYYKSP